MLIRNEIAVSESIIESKEKFIELSIVAGIHYNGKELSQLNIKTIENQETNFEKVGVTESLLIFCFSETHCKQCVEIALGRIKDSIRNVKQVIVLGGFSNSRNLGIYLHSVNCDFDFFRIPPNSSLINIGEWETPCLFIMQPDFRIQHFFFFDENYISRLDQYLFAIKKLIE